MSITATGKRKVIDLNGVWSVGESKERSTKPQEYPYSVQVPALLNSATPAIPMVGQFDSRELMLENQVMSSLYGGAITPRVNEKALTAPIGVTEQPRDYFWYTRTFTAPEAHEFAELLVSKAQFGSEVWVNGVKVGGTERCFTSARYDISDVIHWDAENEITIRVGAHPAVLPEEHVCNTCFEKQEWMPGIWDDVEIKCFNGVQIKSVQVAPKIDPKEILVETTLVNNTGKECEVTARQKVSNKDGSMRLGEDSMTVKVADGETKTVRCTIALPEAELWCPENPALYYLTTDIGGDTEITRFGVREFRFDTPTKAAYLNGKQIFLRGANTELARFLEDPQCGTLPWDEAWLRKLLGENTKKMHWNMLKFCVSPTPKRWFDIADEVGLMVLYEYPVWTLSPEMFGGYTRKYNLDDLTEDMQIWLGDIWNHPCVMYFNATEESHAPWMAEEVLPKVRSLDPSNRAWGNSYNAPLYPNDPVEDHPYEFQMNGIPNLPMSFDMVQLEGRAGFSKMEGTSAHAAIITEYSWLWLQRNGNPSQLTVAIYPTLPYPTDTAKERISTACYLLGGLTEYWRAWRNYAGILSFPYLTASKPTSYTSDYFRDVEKLELHDDYLDYVGEAFKPMGVYINYWHREIRKETAQKFTVMVCNDDRTVKEGDLILSLEKDGEVYELGRKALYLAPLGQMTREFEVVMPDVVGDYTLTAKAATRTGETTISRRWIHMQAERVLTDMEKFARSQGDVKQVWTDDVPDMEEKDNGAAGLAAVLAGKGM